MGQRFNHEVWHSSLVYGAPPPTFCFLSWAFRRALRDYKCTLEWNAALVLCCELVAKCVLQQREYMKRRRNDAAGCTFISLVPSSWSKMHTVHTAWWEKHWQRQFVLNKRERERKIGVQTERENSVLLLLMFLTFARSSIEMIECSGYYSAWFGCNFSKFKLVALELSFVKRSFLFLSFSIVQFLFYIIMVRAYRESKTF